MIIIINIIFIIVIIRSSTIGITKDFKEVNKLISNWEDSHEIYIKAVSDYLHKYSNKSDTSKHKEILLSLHENPEKYVISSDSELQTLARLRFDSTNLKNICLISNDNKNRDRRLSGDSLVSGSSIAHSSNHIQSSPRLKQNSDSNHDTPLKNDDYISDLIKVSSILCRRLNEACPAEGSYRDNEEKLIGLPSWPSWLHNESFDVTKVSKHGNKKYTRQLRLTRYHILNIRKSQGVTNYYHYADIASINISSDHQLITLVFKSDSQSYVYNTKVAPIIGQQIITRLRVRSSLDKDIHFLFCTEVPKQNYILECSTFLLSSIGIDLSKTEKPEPLIEFARVLKEKAFPRLENGEVNKKNIRSRTVDSFNFLCKLLVASNDSPEFVLQSFLKKILYDNTSVEGKERTTFLENITKSISKENIVDIRLWIEGMHSYIATSRGLELYKIYMFTNENENGIHLDDFQLDFEEADDDDLAVISFIIFSCVEESMYSVLNPSIRNAILSQNDIDRQKILSEKMHFLSKKSQKDWGLANKLQGEVSIHNWKNASFELSKIEENKTPFYRLYALQKSIHAIYVEFDKEVLRRLTRNGKKECSLILDDLLAIFIFVFCQSNLKNPFLMREYLWQLVYPNQLMRDFGFYLSIFDLALDIIENIQISKNILTPVSSPSAVTIEEDADDDDFKDCD